MTVHSADIEDRDGAVPLTASVRNLYPGLPHFFADDAFTGKRLMIELTKLGNMMYAENADAVRAKRKAFLAKWRLRCRGVADSLEEAGERLFTFLSYPPEQWKSLRTTNAIERLHEEFKRRIKTQCALPNAETVAMLFWALMASGQITMRQVDGWQTLAQAPTAQPIDQAA